MCRPNCLDRIGNACSWLDGELKKSATVYMYYLHAEAEAVILDIVFAYFLIVDSKSSEKFIVLVIKRTQLLAGTAKGDYGGLRFDPSALIRLSFFVSGGIALARR